VYFDDLAVGDVYTLGSYTLTQEEIVRFAGEWAPHPSHIDPSFAETSFFGGIVAPVTQTYAACARLVTVNFLPDLAFTAGRDVLLQPKAPVRPGQEIHVTARVTELEAARRPGQGHVVLTCENAASDGTVVLVVRLQLMVARRPAGHGEPRL
jgi:acyl dehydratase